VRLQTGTSVRFARVAEGIMRALIDCFSRILEFPLDRHLHDPFSGRAVLTFWGSKLGEEGLNANFDFGIASSYAKVLSVQSV